MKEKYKDVNCMLAFSFSCTYSFSFSCTYLQLSTIQKQKLNKILALRADNNTQKLK